jgi:hypothetical protein
MKQLLFFIAISTLVFSGFYNGDAEKNKAEYAENERLCKIFTAKVEKYESDIREDALAKASLASYKHRADMFCKKAEEAKKAL